MASPTPTSHIQTANLLQHKLFLLLSDKPASSLYGMKAGLRAGSTINITTIYETASITASILALSAAQMG